MDFDQKLAGNKFHEDFFDLIITWSSKKKLINQYSRTLLEYDKYDSLRVSNLLSFFIFDTHEDKTRKDKDKKKKTHISKKIWSYFPKRIHRFQWC